MAYNSIDSSKVEMEQEYRAMKVKARSPDPEEAICNMVIKEINSVLSNLDS